MVWSPVVVEREYSTVLPFAKMIDSIVGWIEVRVLPLKPSKSPVLKIAPFSTVTVCVPVGPTIELSLIVKIPPVFTVNVPALFKVMFPLELPTSVPVTSIFW